METYKGNPKYEVSSCGKVKRNDKLKLKIDAVPKIYWEILSYANIHTKEEVLQQYPEHKDFIESINFNS